MFYDLKDNMKNIIDVSSKLSTMDLKDKRIFLRADLNIPIENNHIVSEHRIKAIFPTINLILQKGGKIILATHIGRPKQKEVHLSTKKISTVFEKYNYNIEFEPNLETAYQKSFIKNKKILLLENLRFFPEEQNQNKTFAKKLANLADYYVNDAFGLLHRDDTSITLVPELFKSENKTVGLLVEREFNMLNKILTKAENPFVLIIGGGKIKDKLPLIKNLMNQVTTVILCPAICFTFLKALKKPVGKSLVDDYLQEESKKVLKLAEEKNINIVFPVDYQIAENNLDGTLSYSQAEDFPSNGVGVSIGPKTEKLIQPLIRQAKTLFFNGAIGHTKNIATLQGMKNILKEMGNSNGFSIVAGGDSVAVAQKLCLDKKINYCSTGGGATLTYLSGKPLIGLIKTL